MLPRAVPRVRTRPDPRRHPLPSAATERSTVDLEDQLAAERLEIEDGRERNRTKESLRLQEESARRLEEQRRESELLLKDKQLEQVGGASVECRVVFVC